MAQHLPHAPREDGLVGDAIAERRQLVGDTAVEPLAPGLHQGPLRPARLEAQEALARIEVDDLGERGVGTLVTLLRGRPAARAMHGREIGPHPVHMLGTDGLDPQLLEPVVEQRRELAAGRQTLVDLQIVVALAERCPVRLPANPGELVGRGLAARQGDPDHRVRVRRRQRCRPSRVGDRPP